MPSSYYPNIVCSCGSIIMKSQDSEYKIRSKILIIKSNKAVSVCKDCGLEVEIPISLNLQYLPSPRLLIKK